MRFFKKILDSGFLNPKESENGFCVSLLDRLIQDYLGSWCVKGTEESTSRVDSSVPLMHHDPKESSMPKLRSRIRAQQKQNRDYLESLCSSQKNISNTLTVL